MKTKMKAVILAAGVGSRIRSLTGGAPKCLLRFEGRTILECQIGALVRAAVEEIAIVTGYRSADVARAVETADVGAKVEITILLNGRFESTNNMYSLALARDWLAGAPFLCLNADVLCHPDLPALLLQPGDGAKILVDPEFREETTKVIAPRGRVVRLGKNIPRERASGTFVNVASFSSAFANRLFQEAARQFAGGRLNQFFNDVLNDLIAKGLPVEAVDSRGLPWAEIDDETDFVHARDAVAPAVIASFREPYELRVVA